jgi:hypothetical protein
MALSISFLLGCYKRDEVSEHFVVTPYVYSIDSLVCAGNSLPYVLSFFESDRMYLNLVEEELIEGQRRKTLKSVDEFRKAIDRSASICLKGVSHIETFVFDPGRGFSEFAFHIVTARNCSASSSLSQYIFLPSGHVVFAVPSDIEMLASKCIRRGDVTPITED